MDLAATLEGVIHLELGEPDFFTPPHVIEAVTRAIATGDVKYTLSRGTPQLRELIRHKLAARNAIQASVEEIVVASGGTTAVLEILLANVAPGDGVLIPDLSWPTFALATELAGGRVICYRLLPEEGYEPDLELLERQASSARVLIINTPANPTGAVFRRSTVEHLVELARRHDLLVISDEVYEDIVFEGEHVSAANFDEDGRVITVFSFSKAYAMTGWRIGYAVGTRPQAEAIVRVQEAVIACPSSVAQSAAQAALEGPREVVEAMRDSYRVRRDAATRILRDAGMLACEPHGTFYALADSRAIGADGYDVARRLVIDKRVGVAPGETFGPAGAGLVRISLATSTSELIEGVRRVVAAARDLTTTTTGALDK